MQKVHFLERPKERKVLLYNVIATAITRKVIMGNVVHRLNPIKNQAFLINYKVEGL